METSWKEVKRLKDHLETLEPGSDEFDKTLDQLNKLAHIMILFKKEEPKSWWRRFADNPALINASAMTIVAFVTLYHERFEIVTSRVFGFVRFK
jgi:hypothetical protein